MAIKGVLFDFDGTLTEPDSLDFGAIRAAIGCPTGQPILEFIKGIPSPVEQRNARATLDRFEADAASCSRPNRGAEELILFIRSHGLKTGIITRNSMASVRRSFDNFSKITLVEFDVILSRDDSFQPKPNPEAVLEAARRLNLATAEILLVGDYIFDIEAGYRAGARTVLITNRRVPYQCEHPPDYTIDDLSGLKGIIEEWGALPEGKLPNTMLRRFLNELEGDSSLLIGPGVGEDVAAVRLKGEDVLVLKSDPVTFASDRIAYYAVSVNVNDIVTSGGVPRWLLATLLFPPGTCAGQVLRVMTDLNEVAHRHGLILCGGHTEITSAVNRPVVAAQVTGTVGLGRLVDKKCMKEGDKVILTKGIAVEGTSLIAREFQTALLSRGASEMDIEACRRLLDDPGISIVREAAVVVESGKTTAMHDVTEGGVATALEELSAAGNHRIRVYLDKIPVLRQTAELCRLLEINPLGLIGSGSLVVVCEAGACDALVTEIRKAGVEATRVGEILEPGTGIEAVNSADGRIVEWPHFEVDEVARVFQKLSQG